MLADSIGKLLKAGRIGGLAYISVSGWFIADLSSFFSANVEKEGKATNATSVKGLLPEA